jgi:hypothetical protein
MKLELSQGFFFFTIHSSFMCWIFSSLIEMCMGISWMEPYRLLLRAWRVWLLCKFEHTCNACGLLPCLVIFSLQFKLQPFNLLLSLFYFSLRSSSVGISHQTTSKAPFQLNCLGLVIWIHCKYELFFNSFISASSYLWLYTNKLFHPGTFQTII